MLNTLALQKCQLNHEKIHCSYYIDEDKKIWTSPDADEDGEQSH